MTRARKTRKRSGKGSPIVRIVFLLALAGAGYWFINGGDEQISHLKSAVFDHESEVRESPTRSSDLTTGAEGKFYFAGEPNAVSYPNKLTILENTAYVVAYDETRKNPAWVAYRIPAKKLSGDFPRPSRFTADKRTLSLVSHDDYTGSGYDRGHMAPNYAIASRFGGKAQEETFLMSNVVPQRPALNQGPWRLLEDVLANVAAVHDEEIWVVVGPIYSSAQVERINNGPQIPYAFFAVVADETSDGPRLQALIVPQTVARRDDFRRYLVSVNEVEAKSGLDFFWELPDVLEDQLEGEHSKLWLEN